MDNLSLEVLLVDDERLARKRLRELLSSYDTLIPAIHEASGVTEAIQIIETVRPGLIFLDIQMPRLDGFALLPSLTTYSPHIIFVSAHEEHALRAFEVNALDYLLKPVDPDRLALALQRLRNHRAAPPQDNLSLVRDGDALHLVRLNKVSTIVAEGAYTTIHLIDSPSIFIRRSISEWENQLPARNFARLDRSLIINLDRILKMEQLSRDNTMVYMQGVSSPVCLRRIAAARLKQVLKERY